MVKFFNNIRSQQENRGNPAANNVILVNKVFDFQSTREQDYHLKVSAESVVGLLTVRKNGKIIS